MKITVLGSAAAEGIPAVFCNCENCKRAAAKGGKDIRTRAQVLVNDDLMIDWPADTYMHKLQRSFPIVGFKCARRSVCTQHVVSKDERLF